MRKKQYFPVFKQTYLGKDKKPTKFSIHIHKDHLEKYVATHLKTNAHKYNLDCFKERPSIIEVEMEYFNALIMTSTMSKMLSIKKYNELVKNKIIKG